MFSVASIVVSLLVAICAGLEGFFGWDAIWTRDQALRLGDRVRCARECES